MSYMWIYFLRYHDVQMNTSWRAKNVKMKLSSHFIQVLIHKQYICKSMYYYSICTYRSAVSASCHTCFICIIWFYAAVCVCVCVYMVYNIRYLWSTRRLIDFIGVMSAEAADGLSSVRSAAALRGHLHWWLYEAVSVHRVHHCTLSCCSNNLLVVIHSHSSGGKKTRPKETNKCVFQQRTDKDLILVAPRGGDLDVKGESGTVMNVRLIS